MAFITLIINIVFSNNRVAAGRKGRVTIRGKQSMTYPTWARKQLPATSPAVKVTRVSSS
jgi:RNase P/RNase MRP subunit p29